MIKEYLLRNVRNKTLTTFIPSFHHLAFATFFFKLFFFEAALSVNLTTILIGNRVAEVAREHGWHPPKSLASDENFKPEHTLFCCELRFVAIYALFGDLWAKKVPFWV